MVKSTPFVGYNEKLHPRYPVYYPYTIHVNEFFSRKHFSPLGMEPDATTLSPENQYIAYVDYPLDLSEEGSVSNMFHCG